MAPDTSTQRRVTLLVRGRPQVMSSDEEEEEVPEDSRIATLYSAADKKSPEEWAALLGELGTKDALVYGSICMDPASVRSHFIVASLIDADDGTLAECLEAKRAHIKAAVLAGGEGAGAFLLAALEGFVSLVRTKLPGTDSAVSKPTFATKYAFESSRRVRIFCQFFDKKLRLESSALCTFSFLLPPGLAALLRSAFFFTGVLFFARMTLSRSSFHGFPIGF